MESPADILAGQRILAVVVVTPEATVLETPAQFVALPLYDGEIGIAPGRAPLIGRLGYGEMRIVEGTQTRRYYVDGGFLEISGNTVTVLTNRAVPAAELDVEAAQQQLDEAIRRPTNTEERLAIRDRLILQARSQIRTAGRAG
ncbi:MAG: ATP synthase F1 subunit epsilon [Planctomycetota bacterium]|nr:ATP synthase F1 subunit epsilon [Planctomycetota bacterium]